MPFAKCDCGYLIPITPKFIGDLSCPNCNELVTTTTEEIETNEKYNSFNVVATEKRILCVGKRGPAWQNDSL